MKKLFILCLAVAGSLYASAETKMMVLSDPHVLDRTLFDNGAAAESASAGDPKLMDHAADLFDLALERVMKASPDVLFIPGDMTKDGERASHEYVAGRLHELQKQGVRVFVVPGNHDLYNPNAYSYLGSERKRVDNVDDAQFRELYADFGYGDAVLRSPDGMSYLTYVNDTLAVLGLYSCQTTSTNRMSAGGLTEEVLQFVDTAMNYVRANGGHVITMMHHEVMEHFDGQASVASQYVANTDTLTYMPLADMQRRLIQAGVSVVLTGHFHVHSIQNMQPSYLGLPDSLSTLTDVSTGATCAYACPVRHMVLSGDMLSITTDTIGTYQALSLERNRTTALGAVNTLGRKAYPMLDGMMRKVFSEAAVNNMRLPASEEEFVAEMTNRFLDLGTELLNTLSRGDEDQNNPGALKMNLTVAMLDYMDYVFNADAQALNFVDVFLYTNVLRGMAAETLLPMVIDPILYNYVTIGGLSLEDLLGSIPGMGSGVRSARAPLADPIKNYVPDWTYTVKLPMVGSMRTAVETVKTKPQPAGKLLRNGHVIVRRAQAEYTVDGKKLR